MMENVFLQLAKQEAEKCGQSLEKVIRTAIKAMRAQLPKKVNPWVEHVREYATTNSIKYSEAVKSAACKEAYLNKKEYVAVVEEPYVSVAAPEPVVDVIVEEPVKTIITVGPAEPVIEPELTQDPVVPQTDCEPLVCCVHVTSEENASEPEQEPILSGTEESKESEPQDGVEPDAEIESATAFVDVGEAEEPATILGVRLTNHLLKLLLEHVSPEGLEAVETAIQENEDQDMEKYQCAKWLLAHPVASKHKDCVKAAEARVHFHQWAYQTA